MGEYNLRRLLATQAIQSILEFINPTRIYLIITIMITEHILYYTFTIEKFLVSVVIVGGSQALYLLSISIY